MSLPDNHDASTSLTNSQPAIEFLTALFAGSEQPIFLQTLANDPGDQSEAPNKRHLLSRDPDAIERFVAKHDRSGRGVFACVNTIAAGARTRSKDGVAELVCSHQDLDFRGIAEAEPEIRVAIERLECPPSMRVFSGGGLHLYWFLREPLAAQEHRERHERVLKRLADVVAGDPSTCEISRLMRLPGTTNSKYGDQRLVRIEHCDTTRRYDLESLEDWLDYARPLLTRKPSVVQQTKNDLPLLRSRDVTGTITGAPDNPWLTVAATMGFQPRLDVEQALAEMTEGNIHNTLLRASASLISRGRDFNEVVGILMEASRQKGDASWNWRIQEKEIMDMCRSAQRKYPPKADLAAAEPAVAVAGGVANLGDERAKRLKSKTKSMPHYLTAAFVVADGVIGALRQAGRDIMLSEGEVWLYGDGFWQIMTPADQQWLLTLIQTGFETINEPGKTAALTSSWKRLNEHPDLYLANVPWASGDNIVCRNGVLQIATALKAPAFDAHQPQNYARRHIGADFDPAATCPRFEALLNNMLGSRPELASLVQEWLGAALSIGSLSREERRALLLVGPSRTGKTELAKIFALLLGNPIATPSVAGISDDRNKFALSSLYHATAWIRDDAINEGDKLNPQRFKTIVTGEPIDIEMKNKNIIPSYRFEIPVCLTCNSLPKAVDGSDAIFNRSLVLRMDNVIDEATAAQARADQGARHGMSIGGAIFEAEAAGILNWALVGLFRLRERGFYEIPPSVRDAIGRFKDDNNPVGEWVRDALKIDPFSRVERRDLVRAYNGWQFEQEGEKAVGRGGSWLIPKLRNQVSGLGDMQVHNGSRYITGIRLTELGLAMWKAYGDANPHGGAGGCATTANEVNKVHGKGENEGSKAGSNDPPF